MADYLPLTDAEVREIALAYYSQRQAKTQPQEHPAIVLVGGQPGAGKSGAAAAVRAELANHGGAIQVDADRMRERIRTGESKPTSDQTQADAGRLVAALRHQAIQGRRNVVEEGTFRNSSGAAQFIKGLQEQGYRIELLAVATSREESLLGIYQRHELQHAAGSHNPRFVAESYHDDALQGFDGTVARNAGSLDRVRVVGRAGEPLYDSASQENRHANALEALAAGRKLTDVKLHELGKAWTAVDAAAKARGAPVSYLAAVAGHGQRIVDMQKERIHANAMKQLDANTATLARDARYANHTGVELAKAAYFRGFHEKASHFKGNAPDFEKYDATAANRSTLRDFPDVADLEGRAAPRAHRSQDGHSL